MILSEMKADGEWPQRIISFPPNKDNNFQTNFLHFSTIIFTAYATQVAVKFERHGARCPQLRHEYKVYRGK